MLSVFSVVSNGLFVLYTVKCVRGSFIFFSEFTSKCVLQSGSALTRWVADSTPRDALAALSVKDSKGARAGREGMEG